MLSTRYATREEAIECELVAALGTEAESVDDFDMERIADEVLGGEADGFICLATEQRFRDAIEAHDMTVRANGYRVRIRDSRLSLWTELGKYDASTYRDLDSAIMRLGSGPGYARRLAIFRPDGSKVRESRWW